MSARRVKSRAMDVKIGTCSSWQITYNVSKARPRRLGNGDEVDGPAGEWNGSRKVGGCKKKK